MSNEELARLLQNLIRLGRIFDIDHDARCVRVRSGNIETDWRQWREQRAGETKTWDPPTIGEQVILLSPGGDLSGAIIVGSVDSDDNPPPSTSPVETVRLFPDGATFKYDHAAGALTVTGIQTMRMEAADSITLQAGSSITLDAPDTTSTGTHTIKGLLTYLAGLAGYNGESGTTSITGDITHTTGNLSSNGVVLHLHVHSGVQRGGSNTDGPI